MNQNRQRIPWFHDQTLNNGWGFILFTTEILFLALNKKTHRTAKFISVHPHKDISPKHERDDCLNTLRPRQNGRRFADNTFKRIFLNENVRISIKISLKFVPKCPINNIPALVQIMAWRRPGDKPLFEPRMESLLTHICVTRPQWVKSLSHTEQRHASICRKLSFQMNPSLFSIGKWFPILYWFRLESDFYRS